jgi:hypothetical protein
LKTIENNPKLTPELRTRVLGKSKIGLFSRTRVLGSGILRSGNFFFKSQILNSCQNLGQNLAKIWFEIEQELDFKEGRGPIACCAANVYSNGSDSKILVGSKLKNFVLITLDDHYWLTSFFKLYHHLESTQL